MNQINKKAHGNKALIQDTSTKLNYDIRSKFIGDEDILQSTLDNRFRLIDN